MIVGTLMNWLLYAIPGVGLGLFFQSDMMRARLGVAAANSWALWSMWTVCVIYISITSLTFYVRYRRGRWQTMRVIETEDDVPDAQKTSQRTSTE